MSGICDMCRRTTCEYRADDIAVCGLPKTETNYERLFGTPERAARTLEAIPCGALPCSKCPIFKPCCCDESGVPDMKDGNTFYDALLEWLRGDAE